MGIANTVSSLVERVLPPSEEQAERRRQENWAQVQRLQQERFAKAEAERLEGLARRQEAERQLSESRRNAAQRMHAELQKREAEYGTRRRQLQEQVTSLEGSVSAQKAVVMVASDGELGQAGGLLYGLEVRLTSAKTELAGHEASRPRL